MNPKMNNIKNPKFNLLGFTKVSATGMICALFVFMAFASIAVHAKEAEPMANDAQVEARLVGIAAELRCLVCQNESLASSRADLAEDLRAQVREQIIKGRTDQEIKDYLVERYGDFVLYRPAVKPMTWFLWFGPFACLLIALGFLLNAINKRNKKIQSLQLSTLHVNEQANEANNATPGVHNLNSNADSNVSSYVDSAAMFEHKE